MERDDLRLTETLSLSYIIWFLRLTYNPDILSFTELVKSLQRFKHFLVNFIFKLS